MLWEAELRGNKQDLISVEDACSDLLMTIHWTGDYACGRLPNDKQYTTENEFREALTCALSITQGVVCLMKGAVGPVFVGIAFRLDEYGVRIPSYRVTYDVTVVATPSWVFADAGAKVIDYKPIDGGRAIANLTCTSAVVSNVLRWIGQPHLNYVALYRIFEAIREDIGGNQALLDTGWISKSEQSRFTQTANSLDAVGDEARHGSASVRMPAKPMDMLEARPMILGVARRWLVFRKLVE